MSGNASRTRETCRMCGRWLFDDAPPRHPATNVGGDCLECVYRVEKAMKVPRRVRCPKPKL